MTIEDLINRAITKVKSAGEDLTPEDYESGVVAALRTYSRHRPYSTVEDVAGTGSADIPAPARWEVGFSGLVSIEYPVGNIPESMIDRRDYKLALTPSGLQIRLLVARPTADEILRIIYTKGHTPDTVPVGDTEAVADYAAAVCLMQLAARYGQTSDPLISADVVNYRSKVDEFRRLAQAYTAAADAHLGIGAAADTGAAIATAAAPDNPRTRLTHGRR